MEGAYLLACLPCCLIWWYNWMKSCCSDFLPDLLSVGLSACLSICLPVWWCEYLSVHISIYLSGSVRVGPQLVFAYPAYCSLPRDIMEQKRGEAVPACPLLVFLCTNFPESGLPRKYDDIHPFHTEKVGSTTPLFGEIKKHETFICWFLEFL